ncbi:response regulator transcription factor [Flavobacterium weaverense]|uniref:LuxR family two component transcriptional regulator n=1 Tax=Flavobacterium weaverense TaxID=271156 RepID=A0A3L9ZU49_9FLAO|nr:response regulator transcription factor [Flavobacterium weaverense]RMA75877.1 LuxR family two component transcriptional regulator [Flavobacterium weaverense]
MQKIDRILVADDHEIVRMALLHVIRQLKPHAHLSEVNDYKSLYTAISNDSYDLLILDVNMPNGSFQEAVNYVKLKQPKIKILVFSSQDELIYALRYLKLGADGYLNKESSSAKIEKALNAMLTSGRYISEEVKDAMISESLNGPTNSTPIESLSNRELQIANKLVEGIPLKELSNTLNLHSSTISTYKNRLFEKLNIQSIPELVEVLRLYKE